jgi:RNase H
LQIYRSIIRSKFDYRSELLYTASYANLKILDSIQHRCLSICCGAAKKTPLIALQNECGELPLNIHRLRNLLRHVARIKITNSNPAQDCLKSTWENYYGKFKHKNHPVATKAQPIIPLLDNFTDKPIISTLPMWIIKPIKIDTKLTKVISKRHDDPHLCKAIAADHIAKYDCAIAIYTDGSKIQNNVGFGIFIPSPNTKVQAKLHESASVFTAELTAIKFSLVWIQLHYLQNNSSPNHYVIYSDSLSSIQAIKNQDAKNLNELLDSINVLHNQIAGKGHDVTLVWIPSH